MSDTSLLEERVFTPPRLRVWQRGDWYLYFDPHNFTWTNVNESGNYILKMIRQFQPLRSVAADIAQRYGLPLPEAAEKLLEFVTSLTDSGFLHWHEYAETKGLSFPRLSFPHAVYLHMTNRCNLKCPYCYNKDDRETKLRLAREHAINPELNTEEYKRIIRELIEGGVGQLFFTGGEPLLRDDTLDLIEYARSLSTTIGIELLTNAIKITDAVANRLCRSVDVVTISLDGHEEHLHEMSRGKHTFRPTIDGIKTLLRARSATGKRVPEVCAVPVLTQQSISYMKDIFRFALEEVGVDMLAPILFQPGDHQQLSIAQIPDHDTLATHTADIITYLRSRESADTWSQYANKPVPPRQHCGAGHGEISIDPHGVLYPCQSLHFPEFVCGDARKRTIKEIFDTSEVMLKVRGTTVEQLAVCKHCDLQNLCNGGCRANAYNLYREFDAHNEIYCQHLESMAVTKISHVTH